MKSVILAALVSAARRARSVALTGDYLTDSSHPNRDVAPNGNFLMLRRAGAESQTIVVHNWISKLREKTAPRR